MLGYVVGIIVVILLIDALFLDGVIRNWAWKRIKNSGKNKSSE